MIEKLKWYWPFGILPIPIISVLGGFVIYGEYPYEALLFCFVFVLLSSIFLLVGFHISKNKRPIHSGMHCLLNCLFLLIVVIVSVIPNRVGTSEDLNEGFFEILMFLLLLMFFLFWSSGYALNEITKVQLDKSVRPLSLFFRRGARSGAFIGFMVFMASFGYLIPQIENSIFLWLNITRLIPWFFYSSIMIAVFGNLFIVAVIIGAITGAIIWKIFGVPINKRLQIRQQIKERRRLEEFQVEMSNLDENKEYDLVFLHGKGFVKARGAGQSITRIYGEIENLVDKKLQVVIKIGTYFIARGNYQNMVTRETYRIILYPKSTKSVAINAACINANRPIPNEKNQFYGVHRVSDNLARFLEASVNANSMTVQAGVWALTDNYSGINVKNHLVLQDQYGNKRQAVSDQDIEAARKILSNLGIRNRL